MKSRLSSVASDALVTRFSPPVPFAGAPASLRLILCCSHVGLLPPPRRLTSLRPAASCLPAFW